MPELPEVETVKTGLANAWIGRTIDRVIPVSYTHLTLPTIKRV